MQLITHRFSNRIISRYVFERINQRHVHDVQSESTNNKLEKIVFDFHSSKSQQILSKGIKRNYSQTTQVSKNDGPNYLIGLIAFPILVIGMSIGIAKAQGKDEKELSWKELESIAQKLGIGLPQTQDAEGLKQANSRCFHSAFQACLEGDWNLIDQISPQTLSKLKNTWGHTLLILAAAEGNETVVQNLIKRRIAVDETDYEGNTPLHKAAENGFSHLIPVLCNDYITDLNHQGKNAHHIAIEQGHLPVLHQLIQKKPTSVSFDDGKIKLTLLALCIKHSRKECLDYLLKQPDYRLDEHNAKLGTLLHIAIHFDQFSILKTLLEDPQGNSLLKGHDSEGRDPLAYAAFRGDMETVDFLYNKIGSSKGGNG
jgi:ankyrin repeat protein